MSVAAAIIMGLTALGTGIAGGIQTKRQREAGEKALSLQEDENTEDRRRFEVGSGFRAQDIQLRREQQESADAFHRGQLRQQRKEFDFQVGHAATERSASQYNRIMDIINADQNLKNSLIAKLQRRSQGVGYGL